MKKIILVCLCVIMMFLLAACNHNIIDTKWDFNYAYVLMPQGNIEYEVKSWTEDENSITFTTEDGNTMSIGYQNCILTKERCLELCQ